MKKALLLSLLVASLQAITLVDHGRSSYSICVSSSASPSEQRGAQELQRFLEEMSGARLPIVTDASQPQGDLILVGDSSVLQGLHAGIAFDKLGAEGFALKIAGRHLIVAGGKQRGTMYGVYTLLDKLGCRWFTPQISHIPHQPTIRIDALDETQIPAFEYREPYFTEAFDKDWAARNRTNGNFARLDASTGGKMLYYPFVHSAYELLPPDKYFKDHPEYYALIDGKRRSGQGQLCLTNPDVLRIATERVREWIRDHPEAAIYSVSQNDCEGWCECDRCRKVEQEEGGEHSGPILRFVNALAAEIEKTNPDKLIDTLAYWYSERPPAHVTPRPNVRIRLCPIGICNSHSFGSCPRSAYFLKNLQAWSKITDQLYIWHYNTNFAHYVSPFPDFDELAADFPLYQHYGVKGLFLEGAYAPGGGGENAELRDYVMARLLWDTRTNVDQAVDEFMDGVYGPAAKPMRKYYDLLQKEVRNPPEGGGRHLWIYDIPDYSDEFSPKAHALFHAAESAVATDDAALQRVRKARLPLDYFDAMKAMRFEVRNGVYAPADPDAARAAFQGVIQSARHFGITELFEGGSMAASEAVLPRIRPYAVRTIENAALRLDAVPEFDGRVVRLIDKRSGRDLLRSPALGENRGIPNAGGLAVSLYPDPHAEKWSVEWTAGASNGPNELVLTGKAANGLRLRRTFSLIRDSAHVETVVENTGSDAIEFVLYSSSDFAGVDIDDTVLAFRNQNGNSVEKRLIAPGEQPNGNASWQGRDQPDGAWTVRGPHGIIVWNRFDDARAGRSLVNWNAKSHPRVTLGVWSSPIRLKPGESFKTDGEFGVAERWGAGPSVTSSGKGGAEIASGASRSLSAQ
ncbi:MAG: DUF4838 domain-containing protein [Bryobacteraceae bacterium]|nr:DUF4838 domain-containing protein [Bryobacteraceae bacterium]